MAWTTPPGWSVGQVSTASDWNTYVEANTIFLANPPVLRVYRTSSWAGANTMTLIPYDTVQVDTASGFNTSNALYTIPVTGRYAVTVTASYVNASSGNVLQSAIYINGNPWAVGPLMVTGVNANYMAQATDLCVTCNAGDTIAGYSTTSIGTPTAVLGPTTIFMSIVKVSN